VSIQVLENKHPSIPHVPPLAGKRAPKEMLIDVAKGERGIFHGSPNWTTLTSLWVFGTSGDRGRLLRARALSEVSVSTVATERRGRGDTQAMLSKLPWAPGMPGYSRD
jgi:hypothetical protein